MSVYFIFEKLGLALLLGSLVGLQREKAASQIAGLRTFPLITLSGALFGLLSKDYGAGILIAGVVGIIVLILISNLSSMKEVEVRTGITTEVAMLIMFGIGAYLVSGPSLVAVAIAGFVAVVLQFKPELHGFVNRLGNDEMKAIMRFALLAFIILPILPDRAYGPFQVLNPKEIWLTVVFIVGLNLVGYIISKFVGSTVGTFSTGILSGMVSSTAATMSFSRAVKTDPKWTARSTTIILVASTVVYLRVAIELAAVSPALLKNTAAPLAALFCFSLVLCFLSYKFTRKDHKEVSSNGKPADVRSALLFGLTYAIVVIAIAAAKKYGGSESLYWVAAISGLTDVDAITLSTANLVKDDQLLPGQGTDMILIAALSNLAFKTGIVAIVGTRPLLARVGGIFGLCIAAGVALILIF